MQEKQFISIELDSNGQFDKSDYQAALRSVRRYFFKNNFMRGKSKGRVQFNAKHLARRNEHVRELLQNRALPDSERLREVCTDESYIHHHHYNFNSNLDHPSTGFPEGRMPHKGQRICFVAAIAGQGKYCNPGLITNSVWAFSPTSKKQHTGDYHRAFNSSKYIAWFKQQLLANLSEPSIIILDDTRYHKFKPSDTPNVSKMRKKELLDELNRLKIEYHPDLSVAEAKYKLRE